MALFDFLYDDPSRGAQSYLEKVPGAMKPYFDPYIEAGKRGMGGFEEQTGKLLDPNFINNMGQNFHQSPGFQFALQQALQSANQAAARGGMSGSPMHEQWAMETATGLGNQEYNNWLQNALKMYGMGYAGQEDLMKQGFDASKEYGENLGANLLSQGNLAYAGGANRNMATMGTLGALAAFMKPNSYMGGG